MPDRRHHRGAHPEDAVLFAPSQWPTLRVAAHELQWLLDRGYALRSALALTGNRHALTQRQRLAIARCACRSEQWRSRTGRQVALTQLTGGDLWIDGYNLLITVEAALAGGIILRGRDECYRDMASLHGTYREVEETVCAAERIGEVVGDCGARSCRWLLDRPVRNSGRLRVMLLELAQRRGWEWQVELEPSPDHVLTRAVGVVASSDSVVLDRCAAWCNLGREIIDRHVPQARIVDLRGVASG